MAINQIPYFIYTNGESDLIDKDWAVKFASPKLDKEKIQEEYENIKTRFGIDLKEEREKSESLAILVLPKWLDKNTNIWIDSSPTDFNSQTHHAISDSSPTRVEASFGLVGFAYPTKDLVRRKNISFIGCIVSDEIKNKCSISDFIKGISEQNNLVEIACLDKEKIKDIKRPDYLSLDLSQLDELIATSSDNEKLNNKDVLKNLSWQSENKGYWIKNNIPKELTLKEEVIANPSNNEKEQKPKGGKTVKNTLIGFVIIIVIVISSALAAYLIGVVNRFFPDNPKEPSVITEQPNTPKVNPLEQIKNTVALNIINYSNSKNNEILVGIGVLKNRKGDEYEIEKFSSSISDLLNLSKFKCELEIKYDIVCGEKELEEAIYNIIKNYCKDNNFYKRPEDEFFSSKFNSEPYKTINKDLNEKFNKNLSNSKTNISVLNEVKIKEYINMFFDLLPQDEKERLVKKYEEQHYIYMPKRFTKFILIFKKDDYIYKIVEFDGLNNINSKGEFFYSNNKHYFKLPVIPNDENRNIYIKKDGNYYKFGKIDISLTQSDKDKIIKDFSRKYYKYILEKNK